MVDGESNDRMYYTEERKLNANYSAYPPTTEFNRRLIDGFGVNLVNGRTDRRTAIARSFDAETKMN